MSKTFARWLNSWRFPVLIFVVALAGLIGGGWLYLDHVERRQAAALAEMTGHYRRELDAQLDAARTALSPAAEPAPQETAP
jgi:hypothetical protein